MATTYTEYFNLPIMDGNDNISVAPINQGMSTLDGVLHNQESMTKMKKISCTSLQDLKDKLTTLMASVPVEYAIELVIVTSPFDIFLNGTHSFTFHKLAATYFWGYGFVNKKLAIIANENGTWRTFKYGEVLINATTSEQRIFLERNGTLYHLHYERYSTVANGTQVTSISTDYAPASSAYGQGWFMQASGYALVRCTVATDGKVTLSAVTHNQNVAGVFDVYWEK